MIKFENSYLNFEDCKFRRGVNSEWYNAIKDYCRVINIYLMNVQSVFQCVDYVSVFSVEVRLKMINCTPPNNWYWVLLRNNVVVYESELCSLFELYKDFRHKSECVTMFNRIKQGLYD